jgi:hypothetical protein
MTENLTQYKVSLELSDKDFGEIISSFEHFSDEENEFIKSFIDLEFTDDRPNEKVHENLHIVALQNPGNTRIYWFTDGTQVMIIKPTRFEEVVDYYRLPEDIKKSDHLNPVIKISSKYDFYATPVITGIEGTAILDRLGPANLAEKAAELLQWAASQNLNLKRDVRIFTGHNVFFDLMKAKLTLFDHGSYDHEPTYSPELLAWDYLIKELDAALGPYYRLTMGTPTFNRSEAGEIVPSKEYQAFLTYFIRLSKLVTAHFGWQTIPFFKVRYHKPYERTIGQTIDDFIEIPVPQTEQTLVQAILEAFDGYNAPRNKVPMSEDGEIITREEAFAALKKHYQIL